MSGRQPACEDAAVITARVRELRAERMAAIAGCECPPDGADGQTHRPGCALEPRPMPPSQLTLALDAIRRARARARIADRGTVRIGSSCITAAFPPWVALP